MSRGSRADRVQTHLLQRGNHLPDMAGVQDARLCEAHDRRYDPPVPFLVAVALQSDRSARAHHRRLEGQCAPDEGW